MRTSSVSASHSAALARHVRDWRHQHRRLASERKSIAREHEQKRERLDAVTKRMAKLRAEADGLESDRNALQTQLHDIDGQMLAYRELVEAFEHRFSKKSGASVGSVPSTGAPSAAASDANSLRPAAHPRIDPDG